MEVYGQHTLSIGPTGETVFTFDVDICFSGGGDTLRVVGFTAELSVLVHTCNGHKTTSPQGHESTECFGNSTSTQTLFLLWEEKVGKTHSCAVVHFVQTN